MPSEVKEALFIDISLETRNNEALQQTHRVMIGQRPVVQTGSEVSDHTQDFMVWRVDDHLLKQQHIK